MSDTVNTIKERLSIVDVVGAYVELKKAGRTYKGRCPFHNEKTPSFFVSPDRGTFHCFGCGKGGDIFTFTEEIEGVDFKGALKTLAERAGVELVVERPEKKERRDRIYTLLSDATEYYQHNLVEYADARAYLFKRGVKPETLSEFRIGFAKNGWEGVVAHLRGRGYSDEEIEASGLGKYGDDRTRGIYDRFRSRIMFPIADGAGRIVGFSGRIFGEDDVEAAKYINSPETEVYKKSHILFGFDKAKQSIRTKNIVILVEGQMDLVLSHQAGFTQTVALSGTALSSDHIEMVRRMADTIVLGLDGDTAGIAAAERSARIAIAAGMDVRMVIPPESKDPADIILEQKESWEGIIADAEHVIPVLLGAIAKEFSFDMRTFRTEASRRVLPLVALIPNAIEREHFIGVVGERLGVPADAVRADIDHLDLSVPSFERTDGVVVSASQSVEVSDVRDMRERRIVGLLYWQEKSAEPQVSANDIIARMRETVGGEGILVSDGYGDEMKDVFAFEAERDLENRHVDAEKEIEHQFLLWKREVLRERKNMLTDKVRIKQASSEDTRTLSQEIIVLIRELEELEKVLASG
ncbi:MAG: DNA primase [Candidatus Yonathbacteria bacterium]|nr:DNA primase [Candidatus Yonathbacteria bacterium]